MLKILNLDKSIQVLGSCFAMATFSFEYTVLAMFYFDIIFYILYFFLLSLISCMLFFRLTKIPYQKQVRLPRIVSLSNIWPCKVTMLGCAYLNAGGSSAMLGSKKCSPSMEWWLPCQLACLRTNIPVCLCLPACLPTHHQPAGPCHWLWHLLVYSTYKAERHKHMIAACSWTLFIHGFNTWKH